jgi:hypothetical protein
MFCTTFKYFVLRLSHTSYLCLEFHRALIKQEISFFLQNLTVLVDCGNGSLPGCVRGRRAGALWYNRCRCFPLTASVHARGRGLLRSHHLESPKKTPFL